MRQTEQFTCSYKFIGNYGSSLNLNSSSEIRIRDVNFTRNTLKYYELCVYKYNAKYASKQKNMMKGTIPN